MIYGGYFSNGNGEGELTAFVILGTSMVGGSFFVAKIYIDGQVIQQIRKLEGKMLQGFLDALKEFEKRQDRKLRMRDAEINARLNERDNMIIKIIREELEKGKNRKKEEE